jgi:hypothetical protein
MINVVSAGKFIDEILACKDGTLYWGISYGYNTLQLTVPTADGPVAYLAPTAMDMSLEQYHVFLRCVADLWELKSGKEFPSPGFHSVYPEAPTISPDTFIEALEKSVGWSVRTDTKTHDVYMKVFEADGSTTEYRSMSVTGTRENFVEYQDFLNRLGKAMKKNAYKEIK